MIKKLLICSLALTPLSVFANNFFYLGAKGGLEDLRAKETQLVSYNAGGVSESIAGGYLGYQVEFSKYFSAAIEAEVLSRDHELLYSASGTDYQAKMDGATSVGVVLKHHYAPNVDFNLRFSGVQSEVTINPSADATSKETGDLNGYQMAVGFDLMNQSQMSFRIEYVYSNYGEVALYPSTETVEADETAIRSNTIMIGAHYRF
ncbi:porin family protein [Catenovulum sp. 2E275]|uniref:outer membrane protein n=1 Tax=Catenovulum sp. 2E275 TaxID=2980497 RepID=UPI0021D14E0D|nr:porin family protein [Catenovulum sp. 2E275]MCU4674372.1 porin family protein [Catenovulum sp. 2E275]